MGHRGVLCIGLRPARNFVLHKKGTTMTDKQPKSFAVEVIADNSGTWAGNGLRFKTRDDALIWGEGLKQRWTLVREMRVVPSDDEPNR